MLLNHLAKASIAIPAKLIRAEKSKTLPTVLTHCEAMAVTKEMKGVPQLMTKIVDGGACASLTFFAYG